MDKVLRMGVIGCGFFGSKHCDVLVQLPNAKLTCVCDVNENTAKEVAAKYDCDYYTDVREMLQKAAVDAVSICVSEDYHFETAVAAAKAKKHILIEKPIATNAADAVSIQKAAEENGVRLMVAHILKWDGRYVYTDEAIKRGDLGEVISMYFKRSTTHDTAENFGGKVSFFHYMIVHDFEAMLTFAAPAKVVKVYSQWTNKRNKAYNSQDTVFNTITFDNGTLASIQGCWSLPVNKALGIVAQAEVIGTKGVSYIDLKNQGLEIIREHDETELPELTYWPQYYGYTLGKLKEEINHFINATLNGEEYLVSTENAIEAVRVIDACFESLKTGLPVEINRA